MTNFVFNHSARRRLMLSLSIIAVTLFAATVKAQNSTLSPEVQMLVDRAAIHDLLIDYYAQIGTDNHDFSRFFTANGRLEVNGLVATGRAEIIALYDRAGGMGESPPDSENKVPPGKFNMYLSNLKISVRGDNATATMLWYSIVSPTLITSPSVTEHGHDNTQLVRQNGSWLVSKRVVTSDGGMPEGLLESYLNRSKE